MSESEQLFGGRYRLGRLLGEGGMGRVYHAIQVNLDREVAIKTVSATDEQPDGMVRFHREAQVAAALKHPNVVEIYDVGREEDVAYLAMEYLRGTTLRDIMTDGVPMALDDAMMVATQLASALVAAHSMAIVHRDLKPENIFLENRHAGTPRVVVVDFGLAFIAGDADRGRVTRDGVVVGTPTYLSPEQANASNIGSPSDIYSFGAMLYEMLVGVPPFIGSELNVLTQHLYVAPVAPSVRVEGLVLPRELEELVMSMLAKRPEDRPAIAEVEELLRLVDGTLSGRRARGRDARYLKDRRARMVSVAKPVAPTPAVDPTEAAPAGALSLQIVGNLHFELRLALASNGVCVLEDDHASVPDAILVIDGTPEAVSQLCVRGRPVLATSSGEDMSRLSALARAGAADVVTYPLAVDDLVRKLHRAMRRAQTRD